MNFIETKKISKKRNTIYNILQTKNTIMKHNENIYKTKKKT